MFFRQKTDKRAAPGKGRPSSLPGSGCASPAYPSVGQGHYSRKGFLQSRPPRRCRSAVLQLPFLPYASRAKEATGEPRHTLGPGGVLK